MFLAMLCSVIIRFSAQELLAETWALPSATKGQATRVRNPRTRCTARYQGEHASAAHLPPFSRDRMRCRCRRIQRIPQLEAPGSRALPRVVGRTVLCTARGRAAQLRVSGIRAGLLDRP